MRIPNLLFGRIAVTGFMTVALLNAAPPARAATTAQAGPYRVELSTDPAVVPVGKGKLVIKLSDASGQPVIAATVRALTKMPGMNMGEREELASPQPNQPGVYSAPAVFPMAGGYRAELQISGPQGAASASIPLRTGQNTAAVGGFSLVDFLSVAIGVLALGFVLYRVRRTGQKFNARAVFNRQALGGLLLLAAMLAVSMFAVRKFRRDGAMTPIQAQGMEMEMPAPQGSTAVELVVVKRGTVESRVRYTGQAVGYVEQEVFPRVTGIIEWMPFYAGARVRRGQLLARLDVSQVAPQVAEREAAARLAAEGIPVARMEYREALANAEEAHAELGMRRGALEEAQAGMRKAAADAATRRDALAEARSMARKSRALAAAQQQSLVEARSMERRARSTLVEAQSDIKAARGAGREAQSDLLVAQERRAQYEAEAEAAQTQIVDAQAQLDAARADAQYAQTQIERMRVLFNGGAISKEELQRVGAQAESAAAKVRQAESRVNQVGADARAATARARREAAAIRGAQAKAEQAEARIEGGAAKIAQAEADIAASQARAAQAAAQTRGASEDIVAAGARVRQSGGEVRAGDAEVAAARGRVREKLSELQAHHAHVMQTEAAAGAARARIAQAAASAQQARAVLQGAQATRGYAAISSQTDGVVTQRMLAPGVLVQPGQAILKIAQLDPIRLQANVAESDLAKIRVGAPVTVRSQSDPKKIIVARVTSISPAVDPASRTAIVEAIVPNSEEKFLPGQYVVMEFSTGSSPNALAVPSRAIQWRTAPDGGVLSTEATPFVWIAVPVEGDENQFTVEQVNVKIGDSDGSQTAILSGLKVGQRVVLSGQQNLQNGDKVNFAAPILEAAASTPVRAGAIQTASVAVTENGYEPSTLTLRAGAPARLIFTRKTDATCGTEVLLPEYSIKKSLPLNKPVAVEFTPRKAGAIPFTCGMNMLKGKVVVR
jgi:RND family efflux transporter MFP subunit